MADQPKVLCESALQTAGTNSFAMYRVPQMSTSDTITANDFSTISSANVYNADTGASMTSTVATNVVTLTQSAITKTKMFVFVVGVR